MWFAQGASTKMRCLKFWNNAGTWQGSYLTPDYYADLLEPGVLEDGSCALEGNQINFNRNPLPHWRLERCGLPAQCRLCLM